MRVLLTGAGGQVGQAVIAAAPSAVRLTALGHRDLDIGDETAVSGRCEPLTWESRSSHIGGCVAS